MSNFDERTLPVSIDPHTKEFVTADDLKQKRVAAFASLENLDEESVKTLVIERIKRAPELKLAIFKEKHISKEQAIREIMSETAIGNDVMEIERRAIKMTLKMMGE